MKRITLLFIVLLAIGLISCQTSDDTLLAPEGVLTGFATLKGYDNAPGAPSIAIPLSAVTGITGSYTSPELTLTISATHNDVEYESVVSKWIGISGERTQLEEKPDSFPYPPNTYLVEWDETDITAKFFGSTGYWTGTTYTEFYNPNGFSVVGSSNPINPGDPTNPVNPPVNPPTNPVNPPANPVNPPTPTPTPTPNVGSGGGEYWAVVKRTVGSSTHYNIYPNASKSDEIIEHAHQNGQGTPGHFISVVDDDEYQIWYYWAWYYNTYILNLDDDDNTNDNRKEENGDKIYYSKITWFGLNQYDAAVESINP